MFRKNKGKEKVADAVPNIPSIADGEGGGWYKKPALSADLDIKHVESPLEIPLSVQSTTPTYHDPGRRSVPPQSFTNTRASSTGTAKGGNSVDEFCVAIANDDWDTAEQMFDENPKIASQTAVLTLKGQLTKCYPLHLIVMSNPPVEFLERVIDQCPEAAFSTDRNGKRTPLHWACIGNASPAVLEVVAHANLAACKEKDKSHGRTPLHYLAIQAEDPEQIAALMEAERTVAKAKDNDQKTPLDLAQDSSSPFKLDIIPALQQRRGSAGILSGFKKVRKRNASPGKYRSRDTSPGKYAAAVEGGKVRKGRPNRTRSVPEQMELPSGVANGRTISSASSGEYSSGEITPPPSSHRMQPASASLYTTRSQVQNPTRPSASLNPPRSPRRNSAANNPAQLSPMRTRSNSPMPPPSPHSSRSARTTSPVPPPAYNRSPQPHHNARGTSPVPPPGNHSPQMHPAERVSSGSRGSESSHSRPSNQSLAGRFSGPIRELKTELEQQREIMREKDSEIAQVSGQINELAREQEKLNRKLQKAMAKADDEDVLYKKQQKITRLREQIQELEAELRREEEEMNQMNSKIPPNFDYMRKKIDMKADEQSSLQAVKQELEQAKSEAKRKAENAESELKSLEMVQMMTADEAIG
eukprot:scaffold1442_cov128-Cylindrotheca_fusiformis.AAC.39